MRDPTCHRCGARARRGPSSRAICERCAVSPSRSSVPELEELTGRPPGTSDDRISFGLIESFDAGLLPPIIVPPRPRSRWRALAVAVAVGLSIGGGAALAVQRATAGEAKPGVVLVLDAKTTSSIERPIVAAPEPAPRVEPPAPDATAPEPEATAPVPVSLPRPAVTPTPPVVDPTPPRPATPALPDLPTRAAVRDALLAVHGGVEACGDVEHVGTTVIARVVFSGETGRVRYAEVVDATVEPEVRSCVARVARTATVDPFARDELRVDYPFRL